MPLFRDGLQMFSKYQAKYNPDVVRTRFADVRDIALARAQGGLVVVDTIRKMIRDYLDLQGITGGERATYLAFALALWRHTDRQKGPAGDKYADGLIEYFARAFGLDRTILTEIANTIIVRTAPTP
jgi:hypothetical protein